MSAVLSYVPDKAMRKQTKLKYNRIQFGDGYVQRVQETINNRQENWDVAFTNIPVSKRDAIITLLQTAGLSGFYWTPPGEVNNTPQPGKYKILCDSWSETYVTEDARTITATFERLYET